MNYPIKEFVLGPGGNLILENQDIHSAFVGKRIEKLKDANSNIPIFYKELEAIFTEFVDVYAFDVQTATHPEPFGSFRDANEKQEWIERHLLALDFEYHLGVILYNFHDWLADVGFPDVILGRLVMDYPNLYEKAVYDYVSVLKGLKPQYPFQLHFRGRFEGAEEERDKIKSAMQREMVYGTNKPYLAAYALPSLIEHFLIGFMQQDLLDTKIREVFVKNQNGGYVIDASDMSFLKALLNKQQIMDGSKDDAMERAYKIIENAGVTIETGAKEIILGKSGKSPIMLGGFLKNPYAQAHIKKPYYDVFDMLFNRKKVNLRNSIMHGADVLTDPFAICFSAVMLQLFWAVIDREVYC